MSTGAGTPPDWRGSRARQIESPQMQAALVALAFLNAVILGLETSEAIMAK